MNFLSASVDIRVDDSKLPSQLAKAKSAVTRTVTTIKAAFSRMATSFKAAFDKMVRYAKWGALAIAGALALVARAAMKQEDAQFLLAAALKISGEWTRKLQHRFEAFAASVQQATIYGDEQVLQLMQLQKSLGVTSYKLEEAAKMSIGLATATGRDVQSMAMYIALAQQGEFTMLRRYIPALRSTTDKTEQLRIVTEFAAAGFKLAEERAKTSSGALRQMWNALGDVAEVIGLALLPGLKDTAIEIKEWAERNQERIGKWAKIAAAYITYAKDVLWTFVKFVQKDWMQGLDVALSGALQLFRGFAAMVMVVMEDLFTGIGLNLSVWVKRGIANKLEFNKLEKEFIKSASVAVTPLDVMYPSAKTKEMEALIKEQAKVYATKKLATGYFQPVLEEAYPTIEVTGTFKKIKAIALESGKAIRDMVPPELSTEWDAAMCGLEYKLECLKNAAEESESLITEALTTPPEKAKEAYEDLNKTIEETGENANRFVRTFQQDIAWGLENSLRDFRNWKKQLERMFEELYWSAMRIAFIQPMAQELGAGLGGIAGFLFGGVAHKGGVAGETAFPMRAVPADNFTDAPRLHSGLAADEFPAILQRGEQVIPRGGGVDGGELNVHIHNESRETLEITEVRTLKQGVIDVVIGAANTDMRFRRAIGR